MRASNNGQRELALTGAKIGEIAHVAGVSLPTASRWRHGKKLPAHAKRIALKRAFGIALDAWEKDDGTEISPPKSRRTAKEIAAEEEIDHARTAMIERANFPPYPPAPTSASPIESARYSLACIRHDLTHQHDLSIPSRSKLRADEARAVTLLARLERDAELTEARFVREHPEFRAHCKRVLEALRPFPAAAKAVLAALATQ